MIKFSGHNHETGRPVLGIGLSRENCERLLAGQPIMFDTSSLVGLPDIQVFVLGGETEESIAFDMLKQGEVDSIGGNQITDKEVS